MIPTSFAKYSNNPARQIPAILLAIALALPMAAHAEVTHIDNASFRALIETGMPVIDLRRPDEWQQTGIIKGSHLLTFFDQHGRYDVQAWLKGLGEIVVADEPVILIFARGVRSRNVARLLDEKLGYAKVYNVDKGINHWTDAGGEVVPAAL